MPEYYNYSQILCLGIKLHLHLGAVPNRALIDCQHITCRYEQLVCPERDNCNTYCYDSRPYACFQTGVVCPSGGGDCVINCNDSYACLQANISCSNNADCTLNCLNDHSCLNSATRCLRGTCLLNCHGERSCSQSAAECSGDTCLFTCNGRDSCSNSVVKYSHGKHTLNCKHYRSCSHLSLNCSGESCITNCDYDYACEYMTLHCIRGNCTINCRDYFACRSSTVLCPSDGLCIVNCSNSYSYSACRYSDFTCPAGGYCIFNFGVQSRQSDFVGASSTITCEDHSICEIYCTSRFITSDNQCYNSRITCPRESGRCIIRCGAYRACHLSTIICGRDRDCLSCSGELSCSSARISLPDIEFSTLNCTGQSSCQATTITCPTKNACTINCDGQSSCERTRVICPTGDYSCNILCTDPLSCSNLRITNTHNVYLQCCGQLSCLGTSVTASSTDCPYIN